MTGSQGQLGTDLVAYLSTGREVIGIEKQDVDIRSFSKLLETFRAVEPEWVIHTAAYTDVDGAEANPGLAQAVNADGTENVARAATKVGAKLLYYSTDYVFDGAKELPYVETDLPNPQTVYGKSKFDGEERVKSWVDNYVIMRIGWVYGQHGKNFVKTMVKLGREQTLKGSGVQAGPPILVVNDQFGNPTWTMDIASQTKVVLEAGLFGIFHATSERPTSWYQFAKDLFSSLNIPASVQPCGSDQYVRPAKRPRNSALENQRLKEAGIHIMRPYDTALAEFLALHGENL
ncbi:MAG: dTDP-4-dehydrorhamnose reductase [candidate division Zixibacteria bacterium]|nr:dTDP-4-dehydrorhamnose reductase [candidate division Zixibacteria bacterium]